VLVISSVGIKPGSTSFETASKVAALSLIWLVAASSVVVEESDQFVSGPIRSIAFAVHSYGCEFGEYYMVDTKRGQVIATQLTQLKLAKMARDIGVLEAWEVMR
jgi:hypothetical protein